MSKKTFIPIAMISFMALSSCSFSVAPAGEGSSPTSNALIYKAPENASIPTLTEAETKAVNNAVGRIKDTGGYDSKNSLYCPISLAIAQQIASDNYSLAKALTDKFNLNYGKLSVTSKNAKAFPESYSVSESYKQTLYQNGISVFQGPFEEMKEEVRKYFGMSLNLDPAFPNAINYFAMSDSFGTPWKGKMAPWNGKDLMYAHGTGHMAYRDKETSYGVRFGIGGTSIAFSWPKEGHELSELSLDELFADDYSKADIHLYVPVFSVKNDFELKSNGMSEKQTAEFQFDGQGVRGKAVTTTTTPGANFVQEEFELWVDRPFHFACTLRDTPLFMGTILNPSY